MRKHAKTLLLYVLLLALMLAIPLSAQAAQNWTAYGRTGHASASGNAVSFAGHPSDPFVTLLFSPASDGDYRTLTFHLSEGNSDWHTLEGSGFLYNADVSNGVINGDAVLFTASSVGLYKLTNVSAASLASAHFTALPGVSPVESKSKPAYSSGTTWYLKLVMSPGSLKVEKHASPTFDGAAETLFNKTFAPSERSPYSGYGPFASFIAHGCPSISTSAFEQFNLTIKPNTPPSVTAPDVVLKRGETFSPMVGVAAMDAEDGNLTAQAQLIASNVDTQMPGVYAAEYAVADILGASGACVRTVTVLADAYFHVCEQDADAPIESVGITTSAGALPDTDAGGTTEIMWVTPGAYQWEIYKHHPDYLPLTGQFGVQIDSAANSEWPMRIPVALEHKYRDAGVALTLVNIGGESGKEHARYNQEVAFELVITNNSNETVHITAELTAPPTLELLCDASITTDALEPGQTVAYAIPCRVVSLLDATTATLHADVSKIALAEDGQLVPDENAENDASVADLRIQNVPIVITKTDVRTEKVLEGVTLQILSGDAPIPFVKLETGAWIKADVAPKAATETDAAASTENLPTDTEGKLTIYGIGEGAYSILETGALPGYALPAEKWAFTVDANAEPQGNFTLTNEPTVLVITKTDATTQKPLDGATFRVLNAENKPILLKQQESGEYYPDAGGAEIFTTKDGTATLAYLPLGKLTLEEMTPPKGYAVSQPILIELKSEHIKEKPLAVTVEDKPLALLLRKVTKENTPLTGAGFVITTGSGTTMQHFTKDEKGVYWLDDHGKEVTLMVNERGELLFYGLPAAEYTVTETIVPDGYVAAVPQRVILADTNTSDAPYELPIINEPFVKLGFDTDGWILPTAIVLLLLCAATVGTILYRKKTGAWWFMRKGERHEG